MNDYDINKVDTIAKLAKRLKEAYSTKFFDTTQCMQELFDQLCLEAFNDIQYETEDDALDDFLKEFTLKEVC